MKKLIFIIFFFIITKSFSQTIAIGHISAEVVDGVSINNTIQTVNTKSVLSNKSVSFNVTNYSHNIILNNKHEIKKNIVHNVMIYNMNNIISKKRYLNIVVNYN